MTTPSTPAEPERTPDATDTEVLGTDADHTDTEVFGADADHTDTKVFGPNTDHTTKVLPDASDHTDTEAFAADADHTTKVLPEASAHSTKVLPDASAHSTLQPPRPKTADPKASGTTPLTPPDPADLRTPAPETATRPSTASASAASAVASARPRVRWAGIIWGLVFAVTGSVLLWVLVEPARRASVDEWWASLTPTGFALTALLVAGGLLLIGGLSGLARRLSHRTT